MSYFIRGTKTFVNQLSGQQKQILQSIVPKEDEVCFKIFSLLIVKRSI